MALCDATMMAGVQLSDKLEALLLAACLRIAAANEGGPAPSPAVVEELIDFPGASCCNSSVQHTALFGPVRSLSRACVRRAPVAACT